MNDLVTLSQDPFLTERTLSFNLMPLYELDESWLESVPHAQTCLFANETIDAEQWLSQYLLDTFDLTSKYWWDFSAPRARLALLDRHTLQDVCIHIGLVLRGDELRAEVNGATIKKLREGIGKRAMDFAFKTAPLIGTPPKFVLRHRADDALLDLMLLGAAYAIHVKAAADSAYATRFLLRLPYRLSTHLEQYIKDPESHESSDTLPPITRRVMKEVAPQWLPLFS